MLFFLLGFVFPCSKISVPDFRADTLRKPMLRGDPRPPALPGPAPSARPALFTPYPLTLKAGSCPSGARCSSRTSSMAFSQNISYAPRALVNGWLSRQTVAGFTHTALGVLWFPVPQLRTLASSSASLFGAKHTQPIETLSWASRPTAAAKGHLPPLRSRTVRGVKAEEGCAGASLLRETPVAAGESASLGSSF